MIDREEGKLLSFMGSAKGGGVKLSKQGRHRTRRTGTLEAKVRIKKGG